MSQRIWNAALDPAFQGLGRRLMAHAEALAAGSGLGGLRLYTDVLMAALGYGVDGREEKPDGRSVVPMSKRVTR